MKNLLDVLQLSISYLKQHGILNPRREVEELLSYFLGLRRIDLYMQHDRPLEESELSSFRELLSRKGKGEPLEYLIGEMTFYNCKLYIDKRVLIPRQETEILLDKVCRELEILDLRNKVLWDLCCGSGCMGIALKKRFPELDVIMTDISFDALEVASINAKKNEVDLHIMQGDFFNPDLGKKVDFIICNPPYISESEYQELDRSVSDFEPKLALVARENGLEFYKRFASDLPSYLRAHVYCFFEIGSMQKESILNLFSEPCWKNKRILTDFSNKDRFFFLEIE